MSNKLSFNHEFSGSDERAMLHDAIGAVSHNAQTMAWDIYTHDQSVIQPDAIQRQVSQVLRLVEAAPQPSADEAENLRYIDQLINDTRHEPAA